MDTTIRGANASATIAKRRQGIILRDDDQQIITGSKNEFFSEPYSTS